MTTTPAVQAADAALREADECVRHLLRSVCGEVARGGTTYIDLRALIDEREFSGPTVDLHHQAIRYAHLRGLIRIHPNASHLARLTTASPSN